MKKAIIVLLLLIIPVTSLLAYSNRSWRRDVLRITGELEEEEMGAAEFTRDFILEGWDKEIGECTEAEYTELVGRSARAAQDPKAVFFFKMGRAGEQSLKALIVATEDLWNNLQEAVEEGAEEYDERHGNSGDGGDDETVQPWEK